MIELEQWLVPWRRGREPEPGAVVLAREQVPERWMTSSDVCTELMLDVLPSPAPGWSRVGDVPDTILRELAERVFLSGDCAVGCCGALANPLVVEEAVDALRRTVGLWRVTPRPVSA